MRSTPSIDKRMRARLQEAVDKFANGSADEFGRLIGHKNGGYVREILLGKKPVRERLIERVHSTKGLEGWFTDYLPKTESAPAAVSWPLDRISPEEWEHLGERGRGAVEEAAVRAFRAFEADRLPEKPALTVHTSQAPSPAPFVGDPESTVAAARKKAKGERHKNN